MRGEGGGGDEVVNKDRNSRKRPRQTGQRDREIITDLGLVITFNGKEKSECFALRHVRIKTESRKKTQKNMQWLGQRSQVLQMETAVY